MYCLVHMCHWCVWFRHVTRCPTDECVDSSDCGDRGVCVDTQSTNIPRRQCFCYPGYHGPRCQIGELQTFTRVHFWLIPLVIWGVKCLIDVQVYRRVVTCLYVSGVWHSSWRACDTFSQTMQRVTNLAISFTPCTWYLTNEMLLAMITYMLIEIIASHRLHR